MSLLHASFFGGGVFIYFYCKVNRYSNLTGKQQHIFLVYSLPNGVGDPVVTCCKVVQIQHIITYQLELYVY